MAWRLARSLETLRAQINTHYPKRNKASDGTIGDARHQAKASDHNPREGVVCAFDITEDFKNGPDLPKLLPLLLKDKRIKYVIYETKLYKPGGIVQKNSGHTQHMHVSVLWDRKDEAQSWTLPGAPLSTPHEAPPPMTLKEIQSALISLGFAPGKVDGILGPKTVKAVRAFQTKSKALKVDGIPGPKTTAALRMALQPLKPEPTHHPTSTPVKPAVEPPVAPEQIVNKPDPVRNAPQWAIALYESLGWSHIQAVALTANLMWESGGNRLNTIKFDAVGDAGHSHGAGQWNDMPKVQRFQGLQDFATRRGRKWTDPETQLLWLDHELATTERRAGVALRAATTIEQAMDACIKIWRPSIPHADKRLAIAKKLLG
jgi:hypothetical protein